MLLNNIFSKFVHLTNIFISDNTGQVVNDNKQELLLDEHREVRIEGPLGAPAEHYNNYEHVIFVAGGVGATPFSSILIGLLYQLKRGENLKHKSVTFYWIQREYEKTDFLSNILEQLAVENKNGIFEINIFITCGQQRYDFR
jgi:NAD(P)H-flavin reductase